MTNSNLLPRCVFDCMYPFSKITYIRTSPLTSLDQFLRAIWAAVSWAIFLSKSPNKTETHSSHIVHFFSVHIWFMFISGWWNDRCYSGSPHTKPICFHQTPLCYETSSLWFPECPHNESIGHKLKVGWYMMVHLSCINLVANDVCHVEMWWTFSNIIVVYYWFIEHS